QPGVQRAPQRQVVRAGRRLAIVGHCRLRARHGGIDPRRRRCRTAGAQQQQRYMGGGKRTLHASTLAVSTAGIGTVAGGVAFGGCSKSNRSNGASALASRWVSAGMTKRASMKRTIEVWSYTRCETYFFLA